MGDPAKPQVSEARRGQCMPGGSDEGQGYGDDGAGDERRGDEALVVYVFVGHVEA